MNYFFLARRDAFLEPRVLAAMVTATLQWRPGVSCVVHWPDCASVDAMQQRICRAFRQSWRQVRAVVTCRGRELFDFEKPWLWLPRHSKIEADVSFERRLAQEVAELEWFAGDDDDDSDGFTTSSSIAEAVESMGYGVV